MHWAAIHGYIESMKLLLKAGAALNGADGQGFTALHHAAQYGQTETVQFLIDLGLPVDSRDDELHTPLLWAAYRGFDETVAYLLAKGADVAARDVTGCTALHWAALKNEARAARVLVHAGASLDAVDSTQQNPEQCAREKGHTTVATYLASVRNVAELSVADKVLDQSTVAAGLAIYAVFCGLGLVVLWAFSTLSVLFAIAVCGALLLGSNKILAQTLTVRNQDYGYMGVFHASVGAVYWTLVVVVLPPSEVSLAGAILLLVITAAIGWSAWRLWSGGPGYLAKRDDEAAASGQLPGPGDCKVCKIRKPLRAQHCLKCDRCVGKYSHHCPWIHGCVGAENQAPALVLQLALTGLGFYYLFYAGSMLLLQARAPAWTQPLSLLAFSFETEPVVLLLVVWTGANLLWMTQVSGGQLRIAASGLTVHETVSVKPYLLRNGQPHNPWDHGRAGNLQRFFGVVADDVQDWSLVFA